MFEDEDQPPPYSSTAPAGSVSYSSDPTQSHVYVPQSSSLFSTQLSGLRGQILEEQAARSSARDQQDIEMLSLLVPHVEALLDSIASYSPPPTVVEATLVPDEAIGRGWVFSDNEQKQSGQVTKLIRVERHLKADGDKKPQHYSATCTSEAGGSKEFDEWGRWSDDDEQCSKSGPRDELWWSDEDMAKRLAKHLQPARATASVDRQTVRAQAERNKATKMAGRWSMFKKDEPAKTAAPTASPSWTPYRKPLDDVCMTVNAEEATFRKQSEMGIWESRTGWGLVVRVSLRRL
ncbi:NAD dependent epimerase/dehydratase family protein, partial [Metarhizium majus ARSEF 297]